MMAGELAADAPATSPGAQARMAAGMRVLLVVHAFPPHVGGMEVVVEAEATHLAESGAKVVVLTSSWDQPAATGADGRPYGLERAEAANLFERRFGVPFPLFGPGVVVKALRLVRRSDVVHVHDMFYLSSLVVVAAARLLRKPVVLTQHVELIPHPSRLVRFLQKAVFRTYGSFILASASRVIVLNERVRSFVDKASQGRADIEFVPNGVDTAMFRPLGPDVRRRQRSLFGIDQDVRLVVFAGRLVPKKGFDILLECLQRGGYEVAFVGGPIPAGRHHPGAHFLGPRPHADMPEIYGMADLFVLPSSGEGFPVTVQEAMASGLPVVTTDDPAYSSYGLSPDVVRLVPARTDDVHGAILALLDAPDALSSLGERGREHARKWFGWDLHIDRLLSAYGDSIGPGAVVAAMSVDREVVRDGS